MTDALFEIRGAAPLAVPTTVLGAWNLTPHKGISFGEGVIEPETPIWSVSLDPQSADENLQAANAQLRVTQAALQEATVRLNEFIETAARGRSYGIEDIENRGPELELQAMLIQMRGGTAADYGALDVIGLDWNGLVQRFQEFLAEVQRLLADPLVVETRNKGEDEVIAQTAVGWTGRSDTAIIEDAETELRAEHAKSLELALGQRTLLFKIAALAAEGAVRLAVVIAMPANAIWMMPGIYNFITRVMDEYFKIRERLQG
ncbi:MAG: hypothetical protein IT331_25740 [Anaerolineae bacterium]|nr:hypothetical protein [Anaerolineae bacterium]